MFVNSSFICKNNNYKFGFKAQLPDARDTYTLAKASDSDLSKISNSTYSKIGAKKAQSPTDFPKHTKDNYQACLLGGAIGDALGYPVEFMRLYDIVSVYGEKGITEFDTKPGTAQITDDTQMTFFTANGLLKSAIKSFDEKKEPNYEMIYDSYLDWLDTQTYPYSSQNHKGWIPNIKGLYAMRAPGSTCIGSLNRRKPGSIDKPVNQSRGCGGVMRVAPVGLMYYKDDNLAFKVGASCAALTHGSPSAYLPAGVLASTVANLVQGKSVEDAVNKSVNILKKYKGNKDTLDLMRQAIALAKSGLPERYSIKLLGEGWHGDESISISTYCALKHKDDFRKAIIAAINHDGDSDSTGAITGNILGVALGKNGIPKEWIGSIELSKELKHLANRLYYSPAKMPEKAKLQITG